jgi:hypothetical protein
LATYSNELNAKIKPIIVTVVGNPRVYTLNMSPLHTKQIAPLLNAPQLLR